MPIKYKKNSDLEYQYQCAVKKYLDLKKVLYTASAGGMRTSIGTAVKMKKAGYKKGTPDIMIFEPRGRYHGLFIEMKTEKGTVKPEQKVFLTELITRDYMAVICRNPAEAITIIDKYLYYVCKNSV